MDEMKNEVGRVAAPAEAKYLYL